MRNTLQEALNAQETPQVAHQYTAILLFVLTVVYELYNSHCCSLGITCNFSFKTKGNLTKHLMSKAHRRRMVDSTTYDDRHLNSINKESMMTAMRSHDEDDDSMGRLVVSTETGFQTLKCKYSNPQVDESDETGADEDGFKLAPTRNELYDAPSIVKRCEMESRFVNDEYDEEEGIDEDDSYDSEDEMTVEEQEDPPPACSPGMTYRRFGQENILIERDTHTPPTLWGFPAIPKDQMKFQWPRGEAMDERNCHSAPPVAMCSPEPSRMRRSSRNIAASKRLSKSYKCVVDEEAEDSETGRVSEGPSTSGNQFRTSPFLSTDNEKEHQVASGGTPQQLIANFIPKAGDQQQTNNHQPFTLNLGGLIPAGSDGTATIDLNLLKITQPQLAALIASALLAKSESQSAQVEQQSGFIAVNFSTPTAGTDKQQPPTVVHPPIQPSTSVNMGSFLALEEYPCTMCEKKFRKSKRSIPIQL